jgi:hypothetical protein
MDAENLNGYHLILYATLMVALSSNAGTTIACRPGSIENSHGTVILNLSCLVGMADNSVIVWLYGCG